MQANKITGIIGIGIFISLILKGISFLSYKVIEKCLFYFQMNPLILYGTSKYLALLITLLCFVLIMKKLKTYNFEDTTIQKKVFLFSFLIFCITQIIANVLPVMFISLESSELLNSWIKYNDALENNSLRVFAIDTPVELLQYILIVIIVLKTLKKPEKLSDYKMN